MLVEIFNTTKRPTVLPAKIFNTILFDFLWFSNWCILQEFLRGLSVDEREPLPDLFGANLNVVIMNSFLIAPGTAQYKPTIV